VKLSFYFDYSSPFAYLGSTQVEAVAKKCGAELTWRPFLLGALFKAIGTPNVPLFEMSAPKRAHMQLDLHRWARFYGVPFRFPSRFPMNTVRALRMTLQVDDVARLAHPIFAAYWADDRDIDDPTELGAIADGAGFDGAALLAGAGEAAVKERLRQSTEEAQQRGVCGAPSFLVQASADDPGMLFWGQDRLVLVERALSGWRPDCG
jgi:2-hydroxychromene-2-carboxylate isomerase